ncbi:phosphomevalonate kinase isoform X1 [Sinocyclocheilus grahami]|uniref:Phosphomevalonate kinase n=1 Tax=Sinocyclocheilus grahami TaxID=75366 RepID=A0A672REI3_SINGR|nr:PREDICTED: phosphomevalonate kinase-like isoform X1 [Sinocyclocheilus grahami]
MWNTTMTSTQARIILLFSGKRKSGKDYVTDVIQKRLTAEMCCILRLSAPLKQQYAKDHSLDYEELLGSGQYKESYRADMICWGEMKRQQDSGFFCRLAIKHATQPIWIISDCRRMSDVQWFHEEFPDRCICVRVEASEQTRSQRGWRYATGIDDAESECGLDEGVKFDFIIRNDGADDVLEKQLEDLLSLIKSREEESNTLHNIKPEK